MLDLVEGWRLTGRPLVVAASRAGDPPDSVRLGLATPAKARIGIVLRADAILDFGPPPSLETARWAAPPEWQIPLETISEVASEHGAKVAVYGSLAWQVVSGESFVRPDSDIDLLIDCGMETAQAGFFARLATLTGLPKLDGEWLVCPGIAVSWQEYARASQDILVKGHEGPWLWSLSRLHALRSLET